MSLPLTRRRGREIARAWKKVVGGIQKLSSAGGDGRRLGKERAFD